ncbi:MAG: helix-turn-helix domain-containing protein [Alphaproteobacteria bacterium]|nr:helix-turn-helix domain-containing protein [Alphaproteobacteria bacterium]
MTAQMMVNTAGARAYTGSLGGMAEAAEPLRAAGTVIRFAQGCEIFAEGDDSDVFYKVLSGVVRVCKFLSDGRRQIEAFHIAGDIFGMDLGDARGLSAETVSECTLVCYRRRQVDMLAAKDEAVTRHLLHFAMENLAHARGHCLLLGRRSAAEKLAVFLLEWADRSTEPAIVHLAMTRQDIADYLGLTIETVSRTFSQFERDGLIALVGTREVHLKKMAALEHVAAR